MKALSRVETMHWPVLRSLAQGLLDVAFPPVCLGCGDRVGRPETILCLPCIRSVDRADETEIDERLRRLPEARTAIDYAFALWIFDKGGTLQHVHHALKYGNRPRYGYVLGEIVGAVLIQKYERRPRPDAIVPVPLHRSRLYERGYNQSERLAAGIARVLELPVLDEALGRTRSTASQTSLSRERRWRNLDGAFEVADTAIVTDRSLLLVDDVLTTGATAGAAAQALKEEGAFQVDLATLAMART